VYSEVMVLRMLPVFRPFSIGNASNKCLSERIPPYEISGPHSGEDTNVFLLKMEAVNPSKRLLSTYKSTWHYYAEDQLVSFVTLLTNRYSNGFLFEILT
jgi:hypothetical protein